MKLEVQENSRNYTCSVVEIKETFSIENAVNGNNVVVPKSITTGQKMLYFCSERDEVCRKETEKWLKFNLSKFNDYTILMRKQNDQRPDWIIKEELWRDIVKKYYIEAIIDDRNQVVRRARSLGLKVFQVEYGNF